MKLSEITAPCGRQVMVAEYTNKLVFVYDDSDCEGCNYMCDLGARYESRTDKLLKNTIRNLTDSAISTSNCMSSTVSEYSTIQGLNHDIDHRYRRY